MSEQLKIIMMAAFFMSFNLYLPNTFALDCNKELYKEVCDDKGHCTPLIQDPDQPRRYFAKNLGRKLGGDVEYAKVGDSQCEYPNGTRFRFCDNHKKNPRCIKSFKDANTKSKGIAAYRTLADFNDFQKIDYVEIVKSPNPLSCRGDKFRICFFEDPNLKGTSFCYTKQPGYMEKGVDVPRKEARNRVSSVRVGPYNRMDGTLEVCTGFHWQNCIIVNHKNFDDFNTIFLAKRMKSFRFRCDRFTRF